MPMGIGASVNRREEPALAAADADQRTPSDNGREKTGENARRYSERECRDDVLIAAENDDSGHYDPGPLRDISGHCLTACFPRRKT